MPDLRDEITKTFLRFAKRGSSPHQDPFPSAEQPPHPEVREGAEFGSYRIIRQLGSGGMGHVYLAEDIKLGRKVALKFLPPALTADPAFFRRFQGEAKTASALNHPGILTIHEFSDIGGSQIIVSEFVEGVTLRTALQRRSVDLNTGIEIIAQIASALTAAHEAGIVHRDLKPTNIMIRPDGYVKVIDFGLAKLTDRPGRKKAEEQGWTQTGAVVGTVGYMSPEQARGEDIDARSDLWSLGVMLYEIISRSRPFEGTTDSHVIVAIQDHPPRPIPDVEKLPPGLAKIIESSLAKDRKKRYQTARAMLADLRSVQQSRGALPPSNVVLRRRLPTYPIVAAVLGCLLVATLTWWWFAKGKWQILAPHWFEFVSAERVTFLGNVQNATISPDGHFLAYVSRSMGSELCRVLELKSKKEVHLRPTPDDYLGLTFSPDSKALYFVLKNQQQGRGRLFSIPVAGVGTEPPSSKLEDLDGPISFSPDGSEFAFVHGTTDGARSTETILRGYGNNPREVMPVVSLASTQIRGQLSWSPRSDWIAAVTYPEHLNQSTKANVVLFARDGKPLHTYLPQNSRGLTSPVVLDSGRLIVFAGVSQGAEQMHLVQLYIPTGEFHELAADTTGLESLSATSDDHTLAAVKADQRSAIWVADAQNLNRPVKLAPDVESISALAWSGETDIIFPSGRTGNVNLARLRSNGSIENVSSPKFCVQHEPAAVPGTNLVVYASNCAKGGDDFNLWTLDLGTGVSQRLTSGSDYDHQPNVSRDGKWVFYTSWSSNIPSIWRVPAEGGLPTQVSRADAFFPSVSPDGSKLACFLRESSGARLAVVVSTRDGAVLKRLPGIPFGSPIGWSPDGLSIEYVQRDQAVPSILRQPLAGGEPQQLLQVNEGTVTAFAWNPGGTKLAYIVSREQKDAVLYFRKSTS